MKTKDFKDLGEWPGISLVVLAPAHSFSVEIRSMPHDFGEILLWYHYLL